MGKNKKIRNLPEGFEWEIKWEHDPDGDISWLGTFMRNDDLGADYIVDTYAGKLLGPYEPEAYMQFVWAGDWPEEIHWQGRVWMLFDETQGEYYAEGSRPVLREDLPRYKDWRWYGYWTTDRHELPTDIEKYGLDAILKDIVADYERHIAWTDDEWTFEGCIVQLKHEDNPDELASASLWGIESDRENSYTDEVERDLMSECLHEFEGHIEDFIYTHLDLDPKDPHGSLAEQLKIREEIIAEFRVWMAEVEAERTAEYEARMKGES